MVAKSLTELPLDLTSGWTQRYGQRFRMERVRELPQGMAAPRKVRLYRRQVHHVLQWWDPQFGRTVNERVEGDLLDALGRARVVDERLAAMRTAGSAISPITHTDLVEAFKEDLVTRANAGEVAPATVRRFSAALDHYVRFTEQPDLGRAYRTAGGIDRAFALRFAAWLSQQIITANGSRHGTLRPMTSSGYVLDVTRAMFEWAKDPVRGKRLPADFANPFASGALQRRTVPRNPLGEPDITLEMATTLIGKCDLYQLRLIAPMVLWGLRPGELRWLFAENVESLFMRGDCIEVLDHRSKGVRNKSLPWIEPLRTLLISEGKFEGLLFTRRQTDEIALPNASLETIAAEYRSRVTKAKSYDAASRERVRDGVMNDAGAVTYKIVVGEFTALTSSLNWPKSATLKDLRHLCQTCLDNGGLTLSERQYLLGQSMGRAAINAYLHLNKLAEHYQ